MSLSSLYASEKNKNGKLSRTGINLASSFLCDIDQVLKQVALSLFLERGFSLFTLNLDHLSQMAIDEEFEQVYASATFITADGWPVVWLARRARQPASRTTGADLIEPVCSLAARHSVPIYLFGTDAQTLDLATSYLTARIPSLAIAGTTAPAYGFDPTSAEAQRYAQEIAASGASICFVALGAPKQERFVQQCREHCPKVGFFCIGASLDYLAGTQRRAPAIIQTLGLEWAWRWICDPRRLTRRYLKCITTFVTLARLSFRYDLYAKRASIKRFRPF